MCFMFLFFLLKLFFVFFFRKIGKMLNATEPKIVNGPQILDKYVGESEANIRKLFADAEEEEKAVSYSTLSSRDSNSFLIVFQILMQKIYDFSKKAKSYTLVHNQLIFKTSASHASP